MLNSKANRLRVEKFLYEKGTNVALYNAEHSDRYQNFQKKLYRGILTQILTIIRNDQYLDSILLLSKAATPQAKQQVKTFLGSQPIADQTEVTAYLVWAGEQGGQAALDKLGIDSVFGLKNQPLIDYFDNHANLLIDSVDEYTQQWLADQIQAGKEAGLSPSQIADDIASQSDEFSQMRAERIVLTETAAAMTQVENETAAQNGIEEKIWRTSEDDTVCPYCDDLDGEQVNIDDSFSDGEDGPPDHPSCRCYMEQVIPADWVPSDDPWTGE